MRSVAAAGAAVSSRSASISVSPRSRIAARWGPAGDDRDVVAGVREAHGQVAADGARSDDADLQAADLVMLRTT